MRAVRPFGRSQLIVTSLASIATLAWVAWRTDIHPSATHRSAAPGPASVRAGALPQPAAATARTGPPALATRQAEDPGDPRRRLPHPVTSDGRPELAQAAPAAPVAPGVGGRIVAIDPETGQLGAPSPEQIRALELAGQPLAVSRTDEVLRETVLANGAVILHLDGRFQDYAVARVDRNGRLVLGCAHDVHGPATALRDSTAVRGLEVE